MWSRILALFTRLSFSPPLRVSSCEIVLVRVTRCARIYTRTARAKFNEPSGTGASLTIVVHAFENVLQIMIANAKRTFSYRVKLPRATHTAKTRRQINFMIFQRQRKLADNSSALARGRTVLGSRGFNWRFIIKICVHATGHIYSRSHARACRVRLSIPRARLARTKYS